MKLLELISSKNMKSPKVLDDYLFRNGIIALRLPPYYCHFNPIEYAWSGLQRKTKRNIILQSLADVKSLYLEGKILSHSELHLLFLTKVLGRQ